MASGLSMRDHEEIRRWAEERGGVPTIVKGTSGLIRIDFVEGRESGGRESSLERVSWDQWFRIFDESRLTFLCSPTKESKFFKIVSEETRASGNSRQRRRERRRRRAERELRAASKPDEGDRAERDQPLAAKPDEGARAERDQPRRTNGDEGARAERDQPRAANGYEGARMPRTLEREVSRAKTRTMSSKSAVPILKDQHRLVERLFQRLVRTRPKEERRACFEVLADHLAAHTAIEERFFYPAAKVRQTEQLLEHAAHEHLEAKQLISDLMKRRDVNGREFSSKVKKLEKAIHDHVREEESTLFPAVQKLFTSGELAEIGANMQELFVQLIEREPRQDVPAQAFQPISLD